jgi:transposase
MDTTDEPFDASIFSKNRDRMLEQDVAQEVFQLVIEPARSAHLLSQEHFAVDVTLIEAWVPMKSYRPRKATTAKTRPTIPATRR